MRVKFILVISVLALALVGPWGCDHGGDHGPPPDPCVGPVPCFYQDWGVLVYFFKGKRIPYWYEAASDGDYSLIGWEFWYDYPPPQGIAIGGSTTDQCHTLPIVDYFEGAWDPVNLVWVIVPYFGGADGDVEICEEVLTISDLWILDGYWGDAVAYYQYAHKPPVEVLGAPEASPEGFLEAVKKAREEHSR